MAVEFGKFMDPQTDLGPSNWGPDIASAATIAPSARYHQVTGAVAIVNITPPYPGFSGTIGLAAAAGSAFTWTAAGNILLASAAAPSVGKIVFFTYNPNVAKWSPSSSVAA